jgi:antitoxin CptB
LNVSAGDAADMGRLRWRCRRGMRELDELLTRYLDEQYPGAGPAEQAAFLQLLDSPDTDLHSYCLRRSLPANPAVRDVIERITTRSFAGV